MLKRISGKILLFGEYALLKGGNALSLPYSALGGQLKYGASSTMHLESHSHIEAFGSFLREHFSNYFDTKLIQSAISDGLYFDSNIPLGYGVGSSGALVAAFLHAYGKNIPESLEEKKQLFGAIESHFHGKSSGLDVLVCYENKAVRIEQSSLQIEEGIDQQLFSSFELIDTHALGLTSKMIETFKNQDTAFEEVFETSYVSASNRALQCFLKGNAEGMFEATKQLSEFTFLEMPWTIPEAFKASWKQALESKDSTYKLCGSGGGGYVLKLSYRTNG